MKFIAAVDENWGIGYKGRLLARISADQQNFKQITMGHVVILGRKTLEEFPGGRPLQGRTNIILSHDPDFIVPGATVVHSIDELFATIKKYDSDELYVIGGQSVYRTLMPYCDMAIITKIHNTYKADAYIPNLDKTYGWRLWLDDDVQEENDVLFHYCQYKNLRCNRFE